jgi:hypothetical protein
VVADYNAGVPTFDVITVLGDIDYETIIPYARIYKRAGNNNLHIQMIPLQAHMEVPNMHDRNFDTSLYAPVGTSMHNLGVDTSLNLTCTGGQVWCGSYSYDLLGMTPSTREFKCENTNGTWTYTAALVPTLNNTQFNDPVLGYTNLDPGSWSIAYYWYGVEDDDHSYEVLGTKQYESKDLAQAESALPELPILVEHAVFLGRIVYQNGGNVPGSSLFAESVFDNTFTGSTSITNHNSLANINGTGTYHVSATENTFVTNLNSGAGTTGTVYLSTTCRLQFQAGIGLVCQFDTGGGNWIDNTAVIASLVP